MPRGGSGQSDKESIGQRHPETVMISRLYTLHLNRKGGINRESVCHKLVLRSRSLSPDDLQRHIWLEKLKKKTGNKTTWTRYGTEYTRVTGRSRKEGILYKGPKSRKFH